MADKLGAIINLDDITHIDCVEKTLGYVFRRPSAAGLIPAACSRSATISWTIREIPSME